MIVNCSPQIKIQDIIYMVVITVDLTDGSNYSITTIEKSKLSIKFYLSMRNEFQAHYIMDYHDY